MVTTIMIDRNSEMSMDAILGMPILLSLEIMGISTKASSRPKYSGNNMPCRKYTTPHNRHNSSII
jgi:hypothetical protein